MNVLIILRKAIDFMAQLVYNKYCCGVAKKIIKNLRERA